MTTTQAPATIDILPARPTISADGVPTHVLVRVTPPTRTDAVRRPVAVALVLDRSGSMGGPAMPTEVIDAPVPDGPSTRLETEASAQGTKIAWLRDAATRLVDGLPDGDALSVVTFDDQIDVVVPLVVLSPTTRPKVLEAVTRVTPRGSTNVEGGLRAGIAQVSGARTEADFGRRVVVLSDGEANVGITDADGLASVSAQAARAGIGVSTIGFGVDYDAEVMRAIAEAGNGDTTHVEELAQLQRSLLEQFLDAQATATDARLLVRGSAGVDLGINLNDYAQRSDGRAARLRLGDLVRTREVLLPVQLRGPVPLDADVEVSVCVEYLTPAGERASAEAGVRLVAIPDASTEHVEGSVVLECVRLTAAHARRVATGRYDRGDAAGATRASRQGVAALEQLRAVYPASALQSAGLDEAIIDLGHLAERIRDGALSKIDAKRVFAAAQSVSRSRTELGGTR